MRLREGPKPLRACGRSRRRDKKMVPLMERSAGNFGAGREGLATSTDGLREDFDRWPTGSKNHIGGVWDSPWDDLCVGRRGKEHSAS
jgi:hypothetical protein